MPMLKETMLKRLLLPMVAAGGGGSAPVQDTATGNPLVFFTDLARPLKSLLIPFTPTQSGTGDPSPDNVRPIVGWTGLTVNHSGADTSDPTQYAVDWTDEAGTVYGGTLDLISGVLSVEWVSLTKTWGDFSNKTSLGDNTRGTFNISSYPSKPSIAAVDAKCNIAPRGTGWSTDSVHFYTNEGSCVVFLPNDTDASTEIQVVYPLATPQEITLTPEQITALKGDNTIWSDADGEMTATYLKKAQ